MQSRSEATRSNILEAAYRLFSENGYLATSVADICSVAKVSKGAFYHHFPTKQAVFLALLNQWLTMLDSSFKELLRHHQNIPDAIVGMAAMTGEAFQSADVRLSIMLEFWTQAVRDPAIWQAAIAPYHNYQAYFTQLMEQGIAQNAIRPVNPISAARCLEALAIGLMMQAVFEPDAANWPQELVQSIHFLFEGLLKKEMT